MRNNLALSGARRLICQYGEKLKVYRSTGGHYDKESMKWLGDGREEIECYMAFFPNGGLDLYEDGRRKTKTAKFYSNDQIYFTDAENEQSDTIEYHGDVYLVENVEERREAGCKPIYIGTCSLYKAKGLHKSRGVEK